MSSRRLDDSRIISSGTLAAFIVESNIASFLVLFSSSVSLGNLYEFMTESKAKASSLASLSEVSIFSSDLEMIFSAIFCPSDHFSLPMVNLDTIVARECACERISADTLPPPGVGFDEDMDVNTS